MVESTIDKIKDITVERQIRKLAGIIDEQNQKIDASVDFSTDIKNLQDSDANQTNQINNLKSDVAKNTTATENLNNRVTSVEQNTNKNTSDITSVKSAITNIQSKDVAQDGMLSTHSEQIQDITESLVSDVQILDGTTTGEIKVRIDRKSAAAIDSNSYNLGLPVSAEIIQGTGPSMFKVQITMSSGVKVVSNDFVFTTEAIGNDVYISSFTFKAGSQNGYLSADIGLNNGVTIEANNFLVPTDPNVIANITDLQTRMTNVENSAISDSRITAIETKNTEQDNKISAIEAKNISQDTAIQKNTTDISSLNTEVSGVMSDLDTKVAISQGTGNAGKVLGIGSDGNVSPTELPNIGKTITDIDASFNFYNTEAGDIITFHEMTLSSGESFYDCMFIRLKGTNNFSGSGYGFINNKSTIVTNLIAISDGRVNVYSYDINNPTTLGFKLIQSISSISSITNGSLIR